MVRTFLVVMLVAGTWPGLDVGAALAVCGDADGSGSVTVTDGVQTLRAAAGLSNSCASGRCDVDGSGSITVTDGVNVLRLAAGLTITQSCIGSTTESVRTFLGEMTKIARLPTSASIARFAVVNEVTTPCDQGFIELDGEKSTFVQCRFGNVVIDGTVTTVNVLTDPDQGRFARTDTYERYEVRFVDTGFVFRQDGTSTIDIDTQANRLVENGTLTIFTAQSAIGQDEYTLTKRNFTTDTSTGTVINGELISALAEAGLAGIRAVTLGFVVGGVADVDVEFDDGHFEAFKYVLATGELTPVSLASLGDRVWRREPEGADVHRGSRWV